MKKKFLVTLISVLCLFIVWNIIAFTGIHAAYKQQFSRADYDEYQSGFYLLYDEISMNYEREKLSIKSGDNLISAYLYGGNNTNGLIVISNGHRDASDIKLYETMYFVDNGWQVLSYDYTGCYGSQGESMAGYTQSVKDLDAVLSYVENTKRFAQLPVVLFGHSLGAYASAAVLRYPHNVSAAVIASGFDTVYEQWTYSVRRSTGILGNILEKYAGIYINVVDADDENLSAVDGINAVDIPVLVISGTEDIFYGDESPIYKKKNSITNENCRFWLMEKENHCGHYDYFLTDQAIEFKNKMKTVENPLLELDEKLLYMEHDIDFMNEINQFILEALN